MDSDKPLRICIEVIPHSQQRYDTVGDWGFDSDGTWRIWVSGATGRVDDQVLIAVHELIEMALCVKHGITAADVDAFDLAWQPHDGLTEPGEDPQAPYFREHLFASSIEQVLADEMDLSWAKYEERVAALAWVP